MATHVFFSPGDSFFFVVRLAIRFLFFAWRGFFCAETNCMHLSLFLLKCVFISPAPSSFVLLHGGSCIFVVAIASDCGHGI